jgi:O-methyltransferase
MAEVVWRLGLWLRRAVPLFQEERLLGRTLIVLRALWQLPGCILKEPGYRSLDKAWLCLKLAFRYTMVSPALLFRMYDIAEEAGESGIEGDLVECGVWNGGSAALLAVATMGRRGDRDVWLYDSFRGLPPPTERDPEAVREFWFQGWNMGQELRVREIWRRLRLPTRRLHIRRGWFTQSFRSEEIGSIAVLHIDCDWYDSVKLCLDSWYDKVTPGGIVILNDYNLYSGANDAVHDFLAERRTSVEIHLLGRAGAYFICPERVRAPVPGPWIPREEIDREVARSSEAEPSASPLRRRRAGDSGIDIR